MGLFDSLEQLDPEAEQRVLRAPFAYLGSKRQSIRNILPHLPYRNSYIEVFGGSGVILLNRHKSNLDVYNDRFGGVVCFYRCLKDPKKMDAIIDWLNNSIMAKEEYYFCRDTWQDCNDPIERAARWFYSVLYSFGGKGRQWGRGCTGYSKAGLHVGKTKTFQDIHNRLLNVQIENASWEKIMNDYDSSDAVFYLDPPYVATSNDGYHYDMKTDEHRYMLDTIHKMKGFVALSGYSNTLYEGYDWDDRIAWEVTCTLGGNANTEGNKKAHLKGLETYGKCEEVLWIKEAR